MHVASGGIWGASGTLELSRCSVGRTVCQRAVLQGHVPSRSVLPVPTAVCPQDTGARKQKRVTLVTPPRSASAPPQSPAKRVAAALHHAASTSSTGIATRGPTVSPQRPVSKLYTPVEPGLFSTRPEAYVHPEVRERQPQCAQAGHDSVVKLVVRLT